MHRLWPWLALALLLVPALQPYLSGEVPRTNDTATHLYRAFELDRLARAGVYFPRWGPDFAHGYGYPTFHYFPYLSHYLIVLGHLAGLPLLAALRLAFALALAWAGAAMFALARDLWQRSAPAGLVAAVAYVYSPYLLYTANVRGGLPESLLLALLPLALLALRRLTGGRPGWLPVGALAVAGMAFSHLGGLVQAAPFIGLFVAVSVWSETRKTQDTRRKSQGARETRGRGHGLRIPSYGLHALQCAVLPAAALLLGVALPAFQWLPARAELGAVQFAEGYGRAGIVYYLNFASLPDLFALPRLPVELGLLNPPVVRPLPLVALGLALLGLSRWRSYTPDARRHAAFFAVVLLGALFLALDWSRFVWDRAPLLQQTLWPWRFLAPASLACAVLAGGLFAAPAPAGRAGQTSGSAHSAPPAASHASRITHYVLRLTHYALRFTHSLSRHPHLILPLLLLTAIPWLYPPRETLPESPVLADLARSEIPPLLVGTTTTGEYTPVGVAAWPDTGAQRAEQVAGRDPERLDPATLPPGATYTVTARNPLAATYLLNLPRAARVTYRAFYFPGWQAALDSRPLPLRATEPHGLIAFDLPAGQHAVTLRFGDTPVRRLAEALSLGSLVVWVVVTLAVAAGRRWPVFSDQWAVIRKCTSGAAPGNTHYALRVTSYAAPILFSAVLILLVKVSLFDAGLTPLVRGGPARLQYPSGADFGGELTLLGYDLPRSAIAAGEAAAINLYWQAQRPLGAAYGMAARLVDERGVAWSSADIERPRDFRFYPGSDNWPADQYVLDPYLIAPLPGTPPGAYELEVVVYRKADLQAIGVEHIGPLTVTTPSRGAPDDPQVALDGGLGLRSWRVDRAAAAPGDPVLIALAWQARAALPADLRARLELAAAPGGAAVFAHDFTIVERYPTSRWRPGEVLTDQLLLRLPAGLETGAYAWRLRLLDAAGLAGEAVPLAAGGSDSFDFQITAPERTFDLPDVTHPVDAVLGQVVRLWGYDLAPRVARPGGTLTVSLIWQALAEMPAEYRVFLHLVDPATGGIAAQSDGAPANWTRPTTGWLPGEVVLDERVLALPADTPPGEYALFAGMADPVSGRRLPVPGAADGRVRLGAVQVEP